MSDILQKIVRHKRTEIEAIDESLADLKAAVQDAPPVRDFCQALRGDGVGLIAEVKKASPSKGLIREDFHLDVIAKAYAEGGANCLSVLTDEHFFQGHFEYLKLAREICELPVLRKDFILDPVQVYQARAWGADAVLLIAECLTADELRQLHDLINELGMTALVEFYEHSNLDMVLNCQPTLVGVNNRDLRTFEVDLNHSCVIRKQVPESVLFVSESGIFTHDDVKQLQANRVDAMLVGESLMRQTDIVLAVQNLLGKSS